jgi:hypothetical protein
MDEIITIFTRVWIDITSGAHAPLSFRLVIQPLIAAFFAIRAGMQDAQAGRPLFFWAVVVSDPVHRQELLREGWKHIGKVFIAAVIVDALYQVIVHHWVYPSEALMVAVILAVLPYLMMRGLVNRILRHRRGGNGAI